jgi:serine/threonine-protein kinase
MVPSLPARYQDPRRIAAGGMATVYAAQDTLLGRQVAIKVLHQHVIGDAEARERFTREARAAARVSDHPHVVTIYDIGEQDGTPFIVMELLSGGSVADRLRAGGPIPRGTALRWLDEAASALDHAHKHDIVHRDVKPANLLLDERDRLAVADFGIARIADSAGLTQTGLVLGTAAYLSPEQALGRPATAASDRYALAVVAFELLTGERPFRGETVAAQARAHAEATPPAASAVNPELPRAVDRVLRRGLDKDAALRWGTAGRMVEALEDALQEAPTRPIAAAPPPPSGRRRIPTKILAGAAALVAGGAVAAFALSGGGDDGGNGQDRIAAQSPTQRTAASKSKPKNKDKPKPKPKTVTQTETQIVTQTTPPTQETTPPADTAPPAGGDPSQLQAQGHEMIAAGDPNGAIPVLQQAIADCPVSQTDPCAYAYYDLGHALRLAGRPDEAIPVLQTRLQNPNQRGTVEAELRQAQQEAG